MTLARQIGIPAITMRGGTSKGVFFRLQDLPPAAQQPGAARDRLMLRVVGSPDPYGKQIDGLGGATSSTSKVVVLNKSARAGYDVDYLFGQVAIAEPLVDWSGNCGNLTAAVGPLAIAHGWVDAARVPANGLCTVRIWQANTRKTIVAQVPMRDGSVQESGDFELDGVAFGGAEIALRFLQADDAGEGTASSLLPTGHRVDTLQVPGLGAVRATLIDAGIPMVFVSARELGFSGTESQAAVNADARALALLESIRAAGAVQMGLIADVREAARRPHTPKVAFVAPAADYASSSGKAVRAVDIDLLVRAVSMGQLHHAMMGTAAVAIGTAAALPGTLVHQAAGGGTRDTVRFGHPSGVSCVGAQVAQQGGRWYATQAQMSRSARRLMQGQVFVPADSF